MSTALIPLATADHGGRLATDMHRARADFVAHLIATSAQLPQTRARRRAEPEEATAAYRTLGQWPISPGRALSRSL